MATIKNDLTAPIYCLWCHKEIPDSRRGHGSPPKTCSEACRKKRASARERQRYKQVKNTTEWQETRAHYIQQLKTKMANDPEFCAEFRAYSAQQTKKWRDKVRRENPKRYREMLVEKRKERANWRKRLVEDPVAYEEYKQKCRAWYHSLSAEEKKRIYYEPRRKREKATDSKL